MIIDELWDDYLQYLIWRCHLERFKEYDHLFSTLHHISFTWIIDRDQNRAEDGMELRDDYDIPNDFYNYSEIYGGNGIEYDFSDHWCSVLEMLIALSIRVDNEYVGDPAVEHPEKIFMEMIKNLKLDKFKDGRYRDSDVVKIVQTWLNRLFYRDGRGSPFPVKHDPRDQRVLEIWDQMNSYIYENYG